MCRVPRSQHAAERRQAGHRALGAQARPAHAVGVPRWRALIAAIALAGAALSTAVAGPDAVQVAAESGAIPVAPDAGDDAPVLGTDGLIHLQLVPGDSELRYVISMRTLLQPTQSSACSTRSVTGELVLTPDGAVDSDLSTLVADMRTLHCAPPLRDANAQALLETAKYPTASATFEQAPGLTVPLPLGDASSPLIGQQSLHGVTRHAEYVSAATFTSSDVTGHATTSEKMTDFNIKPPQLGPLLQVDDEMTIQFDFHATISGGPANPSS
jgi:YceI-like domain